MPHSLFRMFRSKKSSNKENEPTTTLNRTFSCRPSKSSPATSSPPLPPPLPAVTAASSSGATHLGGGVYLGRAGEEDWQKPSAPYHVPSAIKTKKPIRSCPGGGNFNNPQLMSDQSQSRSVRLVIQTTHEQKTFSRDTSEQPPAGSRSEEMRHHRHQPHYGTTSEYGSADPSPTTSHMPVTVQTAAIHHHRHGGDGGNGEQCNNRNHEREHRTNRMIERLHHKVEKLEKEHYWLNLQLRSAQKEALKYRTVYERQIARIAQFETVVDMERERGAQLRRLLRAADQRIREMERMLESRADCELRLNALLSGGCGGAGEALCSLSGSDNHLDRHNPSNNDTIQHEGLDEVRNFRQRDTSSSCLDVEQARSGSVDQQPMINSPLPINKEPVIEQLADPQLADGLPHQPPLRRTYSDTELHTSMMRIDPNHESDEESCSSTSSDSDSLVDNYTGLLGRQLKKRGDVVRFQPRRPTVAEKVFKRFGRCERTALAEFDYLQEMPTDLSGFASSPDQRLPPSTAHSSRSSLSLSRYHSEHSD